MKFAVVYALFIASASASASAQSVVVNTNANPICFICGALNTIATNLAQEIDFPIELQLVLPIAQGTCDILALLGMRGFIPTDVCYAVQASQEIRDLCGCIDLREVDVDNALDDSHVCYICGSRSASITNGNSMVEIPPEFASPFPFASCNTLDNVGRSGLIPKEACLVAQTSELLHKTCGCEGGAEPDTVPVGENGVPFSQRPIAAPSPGPAVAPAPSSGAPPTTSPPTGSATAASKESMALKKGMVGTVVSVMSFSSLLAFLM